MAKYTTEVRTICEHFAKDSFPDGFDMASIEEVVAAAEPQIFNFTYPIWEGGDIHDLNQDILLHFYFREIGFETYGLWKAQLKRKLIERMPYWIRLYPTTIVNYDYMNDFNITEQIKRNKSQNETGNNASSRSGNNTETRDLKNSNTQEGNEKITGNSSQTNSSNFTNDGTSSNNGNTIHSDFPQAPITPAGDYASSQDTDTTSGSSHNTSESSGSITTNNTSQNSSSSSQNGTQSGTITRNDTISDESNHNINKDEHEGIERVQFGHNGGKSPTELLEEYRNSIMVIYPVIMEDLEELFMQIY